MNEEELNEEESLQEPDPSSGVAAPDFTLEQALLTKGRSLLGVGTSAIVRNIYTKISKIDGVQEMITKAQEQLPSISQKNVEKFKTQAAGRIQEIMRKLSESSFDVETLKRAVNRSRGGGIGGGGLPSDDDEEEEDIESYGFGPEGPRGDATDEQIMQAYRERTGELQLDPNRVENRTGSLTGPNPNLLNMVQSPSGSGPTGKITWRNIPKLDRFLSGQTISLDRTTAGLIQNPNFKLGDFLQGIDQELERVRTQYPNIDVDTNLQRFKWQWHHINPDKMPADFYVGLNNVADRDLITDLSLIHI